MRKRLLCILLCLCLLANMTVGFSALAADAATTGTVHVSDALRVRSEPDTSNSNNVVGWLKNNDVVTILDTVTDKNGGRWYKISKGDLTGYASADYITINAIYQTEKEFEAYLTAQGFPESYKTELRKIHAQYPNWVFEARHLSMTWATALAAESKVGINMIKSPEAWMSMEKGAYNWTTNTYVPFDSNVWMSASPAIIAYYMDPRNFLDSTYIFQFEKLTYNSAHTVEGVRAILPTALDTHAEALLQAAKSTNVSAYFLAARMRQEGSQTNGLGTGTVPGYEGYYNFFHIGAYGANPVTSGAIYAKDKGWNTPLKCITDSADYIARGYIRLGQDTNYFQKFNMTNTTSGLYGHQYMGNVAAAASEGKLRHDAATAAELDTALVFSIPVYKEMPATVAKQPSKTGNNNNFLTNITVAGHALTPTFDLYQMDYAMQVEEAVSEITVTATLSNNGATLTGAGKITLRRGENIIPLTVKATSGEVRTYTLTVTREGTPDSGEDKPPDSGDTSGGTENPPADKPKPSFAGKLYAITSTVGKVEPETAVADFIKNLAVKDGSAAVYTADGKAKESGIVGTGDILRVYDTDKALHASYPVVIVGDVNGDGKITSLDLRIAQKHILKVTALDGYYLTAADSSKDKSLTSLDLRITQKFILGVTKTVQ